MSETVAVVGASPRSFWTAWAVRNLRALNPDLRVVPVTPNYSNVHDLPALPDIASLPGDVRAAVVAIRREASVEAVRELTAAGVPDIVLVSNGFRERGDDLGARLQDELVRIVSGTGTRLWGPNCVGFADFRAQIGAIAEPAWTEVEPGPVSIVSQSGALLSGFLPAAAEEGLGVDFCASTGNGAVLGLPEALDLALRRPDTRVVCGYLEGVAADQLPTLVAAFDYARTAGKRIILLKAGASELGRLAVLSHTASIAGTDSVFSELLRQHGVLRADGVDEMMRLASLALLNAQAAVSVLGSSGGGAALSSDLASRYGVNLTVFADETVDRIRRLAGPGSFVENPLDVIGAQRPAGADTVPAAVFSDPNTGLVLLPWSVQFPDGIPLQGLHTANWDYLAQLSAQHRMPLVISPMASVPGTDWVREYRRRNPRVAVVPNLRLTFSALGKLFPAEPEAVIPDVTADDQVLSEADSRGLLEIAGIPVVRGVRAKPGEDLAAAAAELTPPFAVKVIAPVGHKARIGGVVLGICGTADLPAAAARIGEAVVASGLPADRIEGFLVEEMAFGTEVLVGTHTDPALGKYVVVGLGGATTEIAARTRTRRLPLCPGDAEELLAAAGVRENPAAVAAVNRLCSSFETGVLAGFAGVEINPLIVTATGCQAADAVVSRHS
ncbi:acetate--CoA ligase family protein [Amycolatopsis sp. Poz14]|uniref:acetate--CoA ligase family protein n=1 Tax=Amycolatopsis sp. Poz14 TaxID=1447705 RepID=UPI001EE91C2A|nr:acetate--CoA ligase family protein [Amycolatopsis sp. Poz14]MCG3754008.1 acetate--CoA ligase family protein [Amycolatopsis sp. Poz14]